MSGHVYEKHENCELNHCPICDGGLSVCTVCGGWEGSLTSDCPRERMSGDEQDAVYAGIKDFRNGQWIDNSNTIHPLKNNEQP